VPLLGDLLGGGVREGWFSEVSSQWPGQALSLKVKAQLHAARSDYQDVAVFESETYGRVLVLDGCIQLTERDEFSYQASLARQPSSTPAEMMACAGDDGPPAPLLAARPASQSAGGGRWGRRRGAGSHPAQLRGAHRLRRNRRHGP
jgi:hypothetical protein